MVKLVGYSKINIAELNDFILEVTGKNPLRELDKAQTLTDFIEYFGKCKYPKLSLNQLFDTDIINFVTLTFALEISESALIDLHELTDAVIFTIDQDVTIVTATLKQLRDIVVFGQHKKKLRDISKKMYLTLTENGLRSLWKDYDVTNELTLVKRKQ